MGQEQSDSNTLLRLFAGIDELPEWLLRTAVRSQAADCVTA